MKPSHRNGKNIATLRDSRQQTSGKILTKHLCFITRQYNSFVSSLYIPAASRSGKYCHFFRSYVLKSQTVLATTINQMLYLMANICVARSQLSIKRLTVAILMSIILLIDFGLASNQISPQWQ